MSMPVPKPAPTLIPMQWSENACNAFILPSLLMPTRGPKCKLGYHVVFNLILWNFDTGIQWKCVPMPKDLHRKLAIHDTTIYKVVATWAADGSLWPACITSVRPLAAEKHRNLRVLHGDRTKTGAFGDSYASRRRRRCRSNTRSNVPLYLAQRSANISLLLALYHQAPERLRRA
jgi:hypothetical protein